MHSTISLMQFTYNYLWSTNSDTNTETRYDTDTSTSIMSKHRTSTSLCIREYFSFIYSSMIKKVENISIKINIFNFLLIASLIDTFNNFKFVWNLSKICIKVSWSKEKKQFFVWNTCLNCQTYVLCVSLRCQPLIRRVSKQKKYIF